MENRLFLLEDPAVPSGLTANILAGVDVTPEAEYSGKITLTQLNAYSGELKAEALTNFKTIKIEKDGSESFTNVAKLLLELQQGGGVEDAREEADIAIASVQADENIKIQLAELRGLVERHHDKYEAVALAGYDLAVASPESNVRWVESQEADGVRTRFAAKDGMSFGEGIIAILNGVIVTPEDGNIIMSEYGPYSIGFEFNVAPSVGDIVEFYAGMTISKAAGPYQKANLKNQLSEDAAMAEFDVWEAERNVEIEQFTSEITNAITEREVLLEEAKNLKSELKDTEEGYFAAQSVELINKFAEDIKNLTVNIGSVYLNLAEVGSIIDILEDKKSAAQESLTAGNAERKDAVAAFEDSKSENEDTIAMFESIKAESGAIDSPE